jgi:hypothetical protein
MTPHEQPQTNVRELPVRPRSRLIVAKPGYWATKLLFVYMGLGIWGLRWPGTVWLPLALVALYLTLTAVTMALEALERAWIRWLAARLRSVARPGGASDATGVRWLAFPLQRRVKPFLRFSTRHALAQANSLPWLLLLGGRYGEVAKGWDRTLQAQVALARGDYDQLEALLLRYQPRLRVRTADRWGGP